MCYLFPLIRRFAWLNFTNILHNLRINDSMVYFDFEQFSLLPLHSYGNLSMKHNYTPTILQSPCPSVRSHFRNRYLSFYWKKWFDIWYMALAWWHVPCLPFPGLPHIYFLFTVRLRIFHVCRNENFHNSYLSFYWKKW
jgi:hypothetical protein